MTVQWIGRELDDIVRGLYVLPRLTSSLLATSWCGRPGRPAAGTWPDAFSNSAYPQRLVGEPAGTRFSGDATSIGVGS